MKFTLDVDLDALGGDPVEELGRILRYWAGNLKHYWLEAGSSEIIMDGACTPVGTWRIEDSNA